MRAGARVHVVLGRRQLARDQVGAVRYRHGLDQLEPFAPEQRPGSGGRGAAAYHPVDPEGGGGPVDLGVLHRDLRGQGDALGRLGHGVQRAVLDAVHGGGEQPRPGEGEPGEQVAAGVGGADLLGEDAVDRPGVQPLLDQEGRRPGHLVPGHHRVLDGRRAPPGGQQREVQVDPAPGGHVEGDLGQQGPVGDDGAAVRRDLAQPGEERLVPGPGGLEHLDPGLLRPFGHRARDEPAAPAGRGVRTGHDGGHLVAVGGDQGVQGGDGDFGGAGEDELHGWLTASRAKTYGDEQHTSLESADGPDPGSPAGGRRSRGRTRAVCAPRTSSYAPTA